jgi:hypothetical protein
MLQDYEKLGAFYLGRKYDLPRNQPTNELVLYDAKDLTTHAVCVGMTGSGKTGLCLSLLEEAAIDGIPAIAIDPKGDLGNLLLTFPELRPQDFQPWVDSAEAARRGVTTDELAKQTADAWRAGLAASDQDSARIAKFRDAVDLAIYTPGSRAGLQLAVLKSFAAPPATVLEDPDALRERIATAVSGLLALLGITADPLRSREHVFLSNVIEHAWKNGRSLDMATLIREVQTPPFDKVGIMDVESVFPAKERFELSMSLNNLLASPGFSAWMEGEPLDVQRLLWTPQGKPRLSIISIAHLSDAERMFLVTMLLNEIIAWMRAQPGTSSLRAILYMDEVFGYFPPTANPPAKTPMLTLLKQARAFGLGVMLATQNPVDLDYKGLSNAGTWFLGRLQTERDKQRVIEGLESAAAGAGQAFDRATLEGVLSSLGNRVFLMNNVHEDQPITFQTRFALSFLRGPLTRDQIQQLMKARKTEQTPQASGGGAAPAGAMAGEVDRSPAAKTAPPSEVSRPILPPDIPESFLATRARVSAGERIQYRPGILATAKVHFAQASTGVDTWETYTLVAQVDADSDWDELWQGATQWPEDAVETEDKPEENSAFASLPTELTRAKTYTTLTTSFKSFLYRERAVTLWKCASLKATSKPGESEGDFRARLGHSVVERRDVQVEKLRTRYAPKLAALQDRIRKAEQRVEKEKSQANEQTLSTALSFGSSVLQALFGRKLASGANVSRAATSMRAAGRMARQRSDVGHAAENVESLREQLEELEAEFKAEAETVQQKAGAGELDVEAVRIKPRKTDITVSRLNLVWVPWIIDAAGSAKPGFD